MVPIIALRKITKSIMITSGQSPVEKKSNVAPSFNVLIVSETATPKWTAIAANHT